LAWPHRGYLKHRFLWNSVSRSEIYQSRVAVTRPGSCWLSGTIDRRLLRGPRENLMRTQTHSLIDYQQLDNYFLRGA
jgi:hypothetical protein